jgi:hypothetical protein
VCEVGRGKAIIKITKIPQKNTHKKIIRTRADAVARRSPEGLSAMHAIGDACALMTVTARRLATSNTCTTPAVSDPGYAKYAGAPAASARAWCDASAQMPRGFRGTFGIVCSGCRLLMSYT